MARVDDPQRQYGDLLKEAAARSGKTWDAIATEVDIPRSSLLQLRSGRRPPNADQHHRLAVYFEEPRLHEVFDRLPGRRPTKVDDDVYADWVGRWYEVVEPGDVRWEGRRIPRPARTVDEATLRHAGEGRLVGTLKRIEGNELGAVWDMEGRVLLGDGTLLLLYEERRRTLPTASRGVIALKNAGGRTDHLHGVYAKYDYDLQLFVPRPLDWFRDKPRVRHM